MAYVGTFSSPLHDVLPTRVDLPPGNGRGIHLLQVDRGGGAMTPRGTFELGTSPSCLAIGEETLAAGRAYAERHQTTLNALVRELPAGTVHTNRKATAVETFRRMDNAPGRSRGKRRTRDELHARRYSVSRREHPGLCAGSGLAGEAAPQP